MTDRKPQPAVLSLSWRLAAVLLRSYMRLVRVSGRWHYRYPPAVSELLQGRPYIAAFMHQRLFMMSYAKPLQQPFVMLTSHNRAGSLTSTIIRPFNIDHVRGSSSDPRKPHKDKGGSAGLRGLLQALKQGVPVGVTPDGPRGPAGSVAPGIVALAKLSGCPIVPVAFSCPRALIGRGWDKFILPLPLGGGVIGAAEPVYIARDADDAEQCRMLEQIFADLHYTLDAATGLAVK